MRNAYYLRQSKNESLRDVEKATGIDHSTVNKFEKGGGMLLSNMEILAAHFGVKIDNLKTWIETDVPAPAEAQR